MEQVQVIELKKQELLNVANAIYEVKDNSNSVVNSYYYKDTENRKIPLQIDQSGTDAFILQNSMQCKVLGGDTENQTDYDSLRSIDNVMQLANQVFLLLYVIHKAAVAKVGRNINTAITPIVIDLVDNEASNITIHLAERESNASPINIFEYLTKEMYNSLNLFGVYFKINLTDSRYAPVQLSFDITDAVEIINLNGISKKLFVYVDNATVSSEVIKRWNLKHSGDNIRIVNSIFQNAEIIDNTQKVTKLSNSSTHGLLKTIGDKYNSEPFSVLAELYSILDSSGDNISINYPDFASSSYNTSNSKAQLTDGQLRALALFHLQNPNKTISFVGATNKVETDFCKYVADLADRIEGTLSDRLIALNKKEVGKLYCIEANADKHLLAILNKVFLNNDADSIDILAVPVNNLSTILSYCENRINVNSNDKTDVFIPLQYGENPFDYRPDFKLNPLAVSPTLDNIQLNQDAFYSRGIGAEVKIIDVLQAILTSDIFYPFAKAELADFADFSVEYDSKSGYIEFSSDDIEKLILLKSFPDCNKKLTNLVRNEQYKFLDENMPRSLAEKLFIAKCLIHRILRYFEVCLKDYKNADKRLLSLADLLCFESNGVKYIGISLNKVKPTFKVTPLLSPFSVRNAQQIKNDVSGNNVMQLKPRNVSRVIPTSVFTTFDSLPAAIAEIVQLLNMKYKCNKEYKDYVSYGYKFADELTEYLVLYSCSKSQAAILTDVISSSYYANLRKGCTDAIHSAKIECKLGICDAGEYADAVCFNSLQYIVCNLTAQLYNIYNFKERNLIASKESLYNYIDFNFFKSVRLQYSPLTIFGTWNTSIDTVTWHTTLLKD